MASGCGRDRFLVEVSAGAMAGEAASEAAGEANCDAVAPWSDTGVRN